MESGLEEEERLEAGAMLLTEKGVLFYGCDCGKLSCIEE